MNKNRIELKLLADAAEKGNVTELQKLVEGTLLPTWNAQKCLRATNDYGMALLHIASHHGQLQVVRYLLQQRATVDCLSAGKMIALHCAAHNGHVAVARELAKA